jgi:hypothetical protein
MVLRTAMSKTLAILLALALVWLTAWGIAGYFMGQAGIEKQARLDHVSTPATRLERGADVRVEGTIVEGPSTLAQYSQKPCLAAVAYIMLTSSYQDSSKRNQRAYTLIATRRVGPANIEIAVGDKRIELPLERWSPKRQSWEIIDELPPRLGVTPEEIASAKERAKGTPGRYNVDEPTIDGGTRVFVVGRLEDRDGPLRLEADRVLERIELYPGSQDQFVKEMGNGGGGLRVAGWILGTGLGPLPLAIIGLVLLVRSRKRSVPSVARPHE